MERYRNYTFTHNNYKNTELEDELDCRYIIYGKEVGESGTPHLQGVVVFKNGKTVAAARKSLPGCHIEIAKNLTAAIEYCKKDGDFTERGDKPMSQKEKGEKGREYWEEQYKLITSFSEDIDPKLKVTMPRNIEFIQAKELSKRVWEDTTEKHLWYYGPTRTGKSRKARTDHPDAYLKLCNKWWDDYKGEDTVIIEEFDPTHSCLANHIKQWADRYPFRAEYKGGAKKIRPKLIIVTSNFHPRDIWEDERNLNPILERFKVVEFPLQTDHTKLFNKN